MEKTGFLDLYFYVNVYILRFHMFSTCSVKCSVKMTFWFFITCFKYSIRIFFKKFSPNRHFNTQKIIFLSVAFLYSLSIKIIIIRSLNIKELKLLKLQITQTRHPKSVADRRTDRRTNGRTLLQLNT